MINIRQTQQKTALWSGVVSNGFSIGWSCSAAWSSASVVIRKAESVLDVEVVRRDVGASGLVSVAGNGFFSVTLESAVESQKTLDAILSAGACEVVHPSAVDATTEAVEAVGTAVGLTTSAVDATTEAVEAVGTAVGLTTSAVDATTAAVQDLASAIGSVESSVNLLQAQIEGATKPASATGVITPSDATEYSPPLRVIWATGAGNLALVLSGHASNVVTVPVAANQILTCFKITKVAAATTATGVSGAA